MDVDSRTTAEGLEFAGGGDAHVPGFIGVVDRIVEYLEKGRVVYHDKIIVMDDDAKVVYSVPLAIAAQNHELALTRDAKRYVYAEILEVGDNDLKVSLKFGDRNGFDGELELGLNTRVHSMHYNKAEDKVLLVFDHFKADGPMRDYALIISTASKRILHSIELPPETRYAVWSREKDSIDCIVLNRLSIDVVNIRLSDGRTETILSHRVRGLMGGYGDSLGPDGLLRFHINSMCLPSGGLAEGFDGWRYYFVYDVEQRRLFSLNAELGWVVLVRK
jgi:hypothetical protein